MKMTRAAMLIPFAVAAIAQFSDARAATITVCPTGCEHATIQGAISHARDGDTILIYKGHYFEAIDTRGKALTLQGINNTQAIIDANGTRSVITITGQNPVTIRGLTIMRGTTHIAGYGGGITVLQGAAVNVVDSNIVSNTYNNSGLGAGGIYIAPWTPTTVTISGCTIADNNGVGIGSDDDASTVNVENSTIARNIWGGIEIRGITDAGEGTLTASISNSSIVDNTLGAGIIVGGGGGWTVGPPGFHNTVTVKDSTIAGNSSVGRPPSARGGAVESGGIMSLGSDVTLENVVLAHNSAVGRGGGIAAIIEQGVHHLLLPVITLKNTYIVFNSAVDGGGTYLEGSVVNEGGVVIQRNLPDNCGKGSVCP